MEKKQVNYFDWKDIQKEICNEMGIEEKYFRDYHEVIGGDYKDLWHEWMYFFAEINNDSIIACEMHERLDVKLYWIKQESKPWLEPFVKAIYTIWDKYGIEYVKYEW